MVIGKRRVQELLLHVTSDGILFSKTVEAKHLAQRIKNMLNKIYSISISQEICLHILRFLECNTD